MAAITLKAHFDGERIVLDDAFDLSPHSKLMITVLPGRQDDSDSEYLEYVALAAQTLSCAYGAAEPEYDLSDVKERP